MKTKLPGLGDVIAIPTAKAWVLARVLYESSYFKDLILLQVAMREVGEPTTAVTACEHHEPVLLVYTGKRGIEKRKWRVIGKKDVDPEELEHSLRVVAGGVWKGDSYLRPASSEDRRLLPTMDVLGHRAVEERIVALLR